MEFVGIFLLLAPLGALILYLRRSAAADAQTATFVMDAEPVVDTVVEESAPEVEPALEPELAAEIVEEDAPRRMQV